MLSGVGHFKDVKVSKNIVSAIDSNNRLWVWSAGGSQYTEFPGL